LIPKSQIGKTGQDCISQIADCPNGSLPLPVPEENFLEQLAQVLLQTTGLPVAKLSEHQTKLKMLTQPVKTNLWSYPSLIYHCTGNCCLYSPMPVLPSTQYPEIETS